MIRLLLFYYALCLFFTNMNAQQIDTNLVLDIKYVNIGSYSFAYFLPGIVNSTYKSVVYNNEILVIDKSKKVRPYIVTSYDFSYMDENNRYKTITIEGNKIIEPIISVAAQTQKGFCVYFDNIYAKHIQTAKLIRVSGMTLMK
ncbi:MAG: hypothetical protein KatS3mg027_0048 [Bacteroidia bacterium]|nr:MAG: hypothetical protein KatS3mg027_0048 [Bacteroidia bacterium]